jgi:hypothetical protein
MCVIVYKPKGEKKVPKRIFKECWANNSDGAGYAIWNEETEMWDVKKGFMSFSKFWQSYRTLDVQTSDIVFIHFRIGTSGGETPEMTHPFPVADELKADKMGMLEYSAKDIVFHNGVIGFGENGWSDTCVAIRDIVDPLHPYLEDDKVFNFMVEPLETLQNRWIITKGRMIYQYGDWIEHEGVDYSNNTFRESRYPAARTSTPSDILGDDYNTFGFPPYEQHSKFRTADGRFDWDKWEARGSRQSELPWTDPAESASPGDDEAVVIDMDVDGKPHPEPAYNKDKAAELLCCPNCYHDKYLDNSPFSVGDTICLICGCVFVELTGETCTFDHDIHNQWNMKRKGVVNEG